MEKDENKTKNYSSEEALNAIRFFAVISMLSVAFVGKISWLKEDTSQLMVMLSSALILVWTYRPKMSKDPALTNKMLIFLTIFFLVGILLFIYFNKY